MQKDFLWSIRIFVDDQKFMKGDLKSFGGAQGAAETAYNWN